MTPTGGILKEQTHTDRERVSRANTACGRGGSFSRPSERVREGALPPGEAPPCRVPLSPPLPGLTARSEGRSN